MPTLVKLLKLLYPFVQEFGLKEVSIKQFIAENKTLSYMMLVCILMFTMLVYALEQAHLRMLDGKEIKKEQTQLLMSIKTKDEMIEQLEFICEGKDNHDNDNSSISIEESLIDLMGKDHEK